MMREINLWRTILSKRGILSSQDFIQAGYYPADIRKFMTSGDLKKIKAGLYKFPEFGSQSDQIFEVSLIIPKGIFCLGTAAAFHELTTWTPSFYQVAIPNKDKIILPQYPPIELYYWNTHSYQTGTQEVEINSNKVRMYDVEKTVCDIFKNEKRLGTELVKEVLTNYLARKNRNLEQLMTYARLLKIEDSFAQTLAYLV